MFNTHIIFVFLLLIFVNGLCRTVAEIPKYAIDIGQNLSLPCGPDDSLDDYNVEDFMWTHKGRAERQVPRIHIDSKNGSLFLIEVNRNDSGVYTCVISTPDGELVAREINITVRTPPPPLANVVVHASTILAVIYWEVRDHGGYPIIDFTAEYKLAQPNETWKPISPTHISPNSRQIDVYRLEPNTTYAFRVWATNELGPGDVTEVEARTQHSYQEIELAKHFLADAENFDTRVWVAAVSVVMGTLVVLTIGTCYLLYIECRAPSDAQDEQETIELVPNIILNPGFDPSGDQPSWSRRTLPDENCNNQIPTYRLNNNTVVQPRRLCDLVETIAYVTDALGLVIQVCLSQLFGKRLHKQPTSPALSRVSPSHTFNIANAQP